MTPDEPMTARQHADEAELYADKGVNPREGGVTAREMWLAYAQVHAQLATAQAIRELTATLRRPAPGDEPLF